MTIVPPSPFPAGVAATPKMGGGMATVDLEQVRTALHDAYIVRERDRKGKKMKALACWGSRVSYLPPGIRLG